MNLPICDICNKPVDKIECFDKVETMEKIYRVYCHGDYCHGEVEETILTNEMIMSAISIHIDRAFKVKRLSHHNQPLDQPTTADVRW